jgi:thioesterase domain-containing protein
MTNTHLAPTVVSPSLDESRVDSSMSPDRYALPASVKQEWFWRHARIASNSAWMNMPAGVTLEGPLSEKILAQSFQLLVDRHEILRTTLTEAHGKLVQLIALESKFSLAFSNLEHIPESDREAKLAESLREEAQGSFDLEVGPLFRARLFRLETNRHVLIITAHHIISDGWSQNIIQNELWSAYEALLKEQETELPALDIQYGDYAAWQKDWLGGDEANEQLKFWTKLLAPPLPIVDFPTDRPSIDTLSYRGGIETLLLPDTLVRSLKELAQSESTTMFAAMLACFAVLIFRYSGQDQVVIGSPAANRRPEAEPLIGPFAGPFALRINATNNSTFREVLQSTTKVVLDAIEHIDVPFETVIDSLTVRSKHRRNPLFQFYFMYQTAFLKSREVGHLIVTPIQTFSVGTPFELQLAVIERNEGVRAQLEYSVDLFDAHSVVEMLKYYENILNAFVSTPDQKISELELPTHIDFKHRLPNQSDVARGHESPKTDVEIALTEVWEEILDQPNIGIGDNFFELGGNSLVAARLHSELKRKFGYVLDLSTLIVAPTIKQLAEKLAIAPSMTESSLVALQPSGTKRPLFCVHTADGHVLMYRHLAACMPADQPVYALRAPDFGGNYREVNLRGLARKYLDDIRAVQPAGPYQLCGLSFGGLLAYEMATQLIETGEQVSIVALFDTGNPAYYRNLSFLKALQFRTTYLGDRFLKYSRNIGRGDFSQAFNDISRFISGRVKQLTWRVVRRFFARSNRTVPSQLWDGFTMFVTLGREFTPKALTAKLVLFRAAGRTAEYGNDKTLGWQLVAKGGMEVLEIPGGHASIMIKPNVYCLVERLNFYLNETNREFFVTEPEDRPVPADTAERSRPGLYVR